jgi:hypothetical protein
MHTDPTIDPLAAGRDGSAGSPADRSGPEQHVPNKHKQDPLLPESVNIENDPDEEARNGAEGDESRDPDAASRHFRQR